MKRELKNKSLEINYLLTIIVFKYKSDMEYLYKTLENWNKKYPGYKSFFDYYENYWYKYLKDGSIGYTKLQNCKDVIHT